VFSFADCHPRVAMPLARHLLLRNIELRFKYPKVIYFSPLDCSGYNYQSLFILKDIDSTSILTNVNDKIPDSDTSQGCEAISTKFAVPAS
jgi:hypothetical protein